MMEHLKDLNVVITAAASGIGVEIAKILMKNGSNVIVCDKNEVALKRLNNECPGLLSMNIDVSNEEDVLRFFDEVASKFGSIDALINNAGIAGPSSELVNVEMKDWEDTIRVNLTGTFLCSRSAIPLLQKSDGGSIINIGSTSSFMGTPLRSAYTASKWGLIGLTKTWAMEYGKDKIRVNTICPTSVSGERIDGVIKRDAEYRNTTPEKIKEEYLNQTSLKTFIDSEEIAGMVVYLLSPLAKNISGQMMVIDGNTETLSMPEIKKE
jgi:NAD(P)-dependent dehydrogenase (short-subunit alcohol dehydrogenase family)